jgi:thymidylate synthase
VYILAAKSGLKPGKLFYTGTDVHIYKNHKNQLIKQCKNNKKVSPKLILSEFVKTKTFDELTVDDFDIIGYYPGSYIPMKMAI